MARIEPLSTFSLIHSEIKRLCFLYTRKCNLTCTHCALECSPQETEQLEFDKVNKNIDDAAALGINGIVFSGGEALLYFDEIVKLIQKAHANKQKVTVITNGMWSCSKSIIKWRVKQLKEAGVGMLTISYDEFHKKGGARINWIKNVIIACSEAGVDTTIKRISRAAWNSTIDADSLKIAKELRNLNCKVVTESLAPFGSARKNYAGTGRQYVRESMSVFTRCNNIGAVTYYTNGDLFPCCSPAISALAKFRDDNPLKLGNIYVNTLEECLKKAQASLFIKVLAKKGFCGFRALSKLYPNDVIWPSKLAHKCDFCIFAAKDSRFRRWLSLLEKDRYKVLPRLPHYVVL